MGVRDLILEILKQKGVVKVADLTERTGYSRAYVNRFLQELRREGKIVLVGKANRARYVPSAAGVARRAKRSILSVNRILTNQNLFEDKVLDEIKRDSGIFDRLPHNVGRIVEYGFTEMLNNAIEHSRSPKIFVRMNRTPGDITFRVIDRGIGIFKNMMQTRKLQSELEAIQDLLKGKQTTDPERHTGEGIFFTSKVADRLVIKGSSKNLVFDNEVGDVFVKEGRPIAGTEVDFRVSSRSNKQLADVFGEYAGEGFEFGTTSVRVDLYRVKGSFISRSQARRILAGLEKFNLIILDFKGVDTIGQAFADEVMRVWQQHHPDKRVEIRNANESIQFMIGRARSSVA